MSAKDQAIYWKPRLKKRSFNHQGSVKEISQWYMRLMYQGKRDWIGLGTANKDAAAKLAAEKWKIVSSQGWEGLSQKGTDNDVLTIEFFLDTAEGVLVRNGDLSPVAFRTYRERLEKIVKRTLNLPSYAGKDYNKKKSDENRRKIYSARLDIVNEESINRFKDALKKEGKKDTSIKSDLVNAGSLFSKEVIKELGIDNPFSEVKKPKIKVKDLKYKSCFDLASLLKTAEAKAKKDDSFRSAYICLVLAAGTGARRGELDLLKWSDINFENGTVDFNGPHLKTDASSDEIKIVESCLSRLETFRNQNSDAEYILEGMPTAPTIIDLKYYRCESMLKKAISFLRGYKDGCNTPFAIGEVDKPLHTIRKEVGSILYKTTGDIYLVKEYLRHADIKTTILYYVDGGTPEAPKLDF